MKRLALIVAILFTQLSLVQAEPHRAPLPSPDSRGDYSGNQHHDFWTVVDPDPNGLNARQAKQTYEMEHPKPGENFLKLKVVTRLKKGQDFSLRKIVKDDRNRPWMMVRLYPTWKYGQDLLLVRAHKDFVRPIRSPWPLADDQGNYESDLHPQWIVVDPDPAGLNGRLHPTFPRHVGDAGAVWPTSPVDTWPVVTSVPKGTKLRAISGHRGVIHMDGRDGNPWVLVTRLEDYEAGSDYQKFFVRSHRRYIEPIEPR